MPFDTYGIVHMLNVQLVCIPLYNFKFALNCIAVNCIAVSVVLVYRFDKSPGNIPLFSNECSIEKRC